MYIFIFLLSLVGGIFRFYNLNWGSPFYFHPDERNIASSVVNINFPTQMNPHFFAYGSFPIYLIYFTNLISNLFLKFQDLFTQGIFISRFYSAILSLLIIPSIYFVGTKLHSRKVGLLSAAFCTFSVGFIQFAHFGTFEMWLTLLGIWLFYFSLKLTKKINIKNIFIAGTIFGLLMATKISSLSSFTIIPFSILVNLIAKYKKIQHYPVYCKYIGIFAVIILVSSLVFFAVSPFALLGYQASLSSLKYESSVVFGSLSVFYTGAFFDSIPILFQFTKVYPFLMNPILTAIFIPSFFYLSYKGIKTRNLKYLLLNTFYLMLFIPQSFLFAKWTRYMIPTLPFIYLIISIVLIDLFNWKKNFYYKYIGIFVVIVLSFILAVSYFITAFVRSDTRIEAGLWAKENIPAQSIILSEVYDMGIVPFNQFFPNISLFNFYDLDQAANSKSFELKNLLSRSEYIILPSQRILKTRISNKNKFPVGNKFYTDLLAGQLKFKKIYETPCDLFCKITYLGNPVFNFEETSNVFDHPTVFIFKKI